MADSFITQCPHCGTSFRVKTEQLAIANGSVRCGACLQVFSADSHVVTTSIPAQSPSKVSPTAKRAAPNSAIPKPVEKDSRDYKIDDEDDSEFLFVDEDDEEFIFKDDENDDDLFDEDDTHDGFGELSDSFLNLNNPKESPLQSDHFQSETQILNKELFEEIDDASDESWAESMLDEIEKEETSTRKPAVFESKNVSAAPSQSDAHNAAMRRSALFADLEDDQDTADTPSASQVVNQASQDFDLEFQFESRLNRLRPLGWLLVILLIVVLLAQLAWFQRDTFARMDQWRSFYVQACDYIGCELPEQVDVSKIRTSVIVRDHKNTALNDIKIVDIVLTNRASFKQPFPEILLQYSDVNGKVIADQSFLPNDYLKGEMTGVSTMPLNTRIYVSIPIQAPAVGAVNYQLILNPLSI